MTLQERYIRYMLAMGLTEYKTKTTKARVFKSPQNEIYYFVGKRGSVRFNTVNKYSGSISVVKGLRGNMEKWEKLGNG